MKSLPRHVNLRRRQLVGGGLWAALWGGAPSVAAATGKRVALVMGNASYPGAALKNAGNDARLMQATARELGFQADLLLDGTHAQMLAALRAWLVASADASLRLFYFAGHGAQYRGHNFLIPVDAELRSEDDIPGYAVNVNDLSDRLSRFDAGGVSLVILDACRNAPRLALPPGARARGPGGPASQAGLAEAAAPRGTLVAYATAPGALAGDNPGVANGVYTRHLAAQLRTPGLPIEAVFKRTRAAVLKETGGTQVPWEHSNLVGELCLSPVRGGACGGR